MASWRGIQIDSLLGGSSSLAETQVKGSRKFVLYVRELIKKNFDMVIPQVQSWLGSECTRKTG